MVRDGAELALLDYRWLYRFPYRHANCQSPGLALTFPLQNKAKNKDKVPKGQERTDRHRRHSVFGRRTTARSDHHCGDGVQNIWKTGSRTGKQALSALSQISTLMASPIESCRSGWRTTANECHQKGSQRRLSYLANICFRSQALLREASIISESFQGWEESSTLVAAWLPVVHSAFGQKLGAFRQEVCAMQAIRLPIAACQG